MFHFLSGMKSKTPRRLVPVFFFQRRIKPLTIFVLFLSTDFKMLPKRFLTQILSLLCVPGGERRSGHRQLSLLPASVHGAMAERSHVRCHHCGYEEVRAPLSLLSASAFCFALQQNVWPRKGTEGIQLAYKSTVTFAAILSHILLFLFLFLLLSSLPPSPFFFLLFNHVCHLFHYVYAFVYFLPPVGSQTF